jgi:hypothetical protein
MLFCSFANAAIVAANLQLECHGFTCRQTSVQSTLRPLLQKPLLVAFVLPPLTVKFIHR